MKIEKSIMAAWIGEGLCVAWWFVRISNENFNTFPVALTMILISWVCALWYCYEVDLKPASKKKRKFGTGRTYSDEEYMHFRFVNRNCNNLKGGFTDANVNRVPIEGERDRVANGGKPRNNPSRWV